MLSAIKAAWGRKLESVDAWRGGFALAALACAAAYAAGEVFWEVRPGSVLGMSFGIAAALLLAATALYGARRRAMRLATRLGLGTSRAWLALHLYGGGLFLLLVLFHTRFHLPSGTLMWWLWLLSLWTVMSGLAGRAIQRFLPRVLSSGLETEANYERIPELVAELRGRAEALAATSERAIRTLYDRRLAPVLEQPERRWIFFFDVTGGARARLRELEYLEERLTPNERARLVELERLYRAKIELDAHYTLQPVLRLWPWVHVPPSLALVALVVVHIVTVIYY